jgi:hypothetical protein
MLKEMININIEAIWEKKIIKRIFIKTGLLAGNQKQT